MATVVDNDTTVESNDSKLEDSRVEGETEESEKEELAIDDSFSKSSVQKPVIVEGKRQRTAVQTFTSAAPAKEKKGLEFEVGRGTLLGEIEIVTEYMSKTHSDSYISMHRLMYNSQGVSLQRKGNVRRFNGFSFDEDSKLYSSKLTSIKKMKSVDRKLSMKLLGLNQNSTMQELMDFLMSPEDKGRHAPNKKKSKTPSKRRRSSTKDNEGKTTPAKKKSSAKSKPKTTPKRKKATPKKRDTDDEVEGDDSLSESESVSEDNDHETNTITNPTKKRKLSESITDISKDDSFSGPTDEDLIGAIKKTVENIDLEEVSMKDALKKIYGLYPGVDLTDRKSFIKDNIRKLIG